MENAKSKSLLPFIFIPLLFFIFIRPFFSGLAYPILENYYQNILIFFAIISLFFARKGSEKNPYTIPILILLSAYILSTILSVNIQNSLKESIKFISYLSIFFLVSQCSDRDKKIIIKTIVLAASIIGLYSIYQYFWGYKHTLNYLQKINSNFLSTSSYAKDILIAKRAIGTFPSPNLLGGYLLIAFFLSLHLRSPSPLPSPLWGEGRVRRTLFLPLIILFALILTKSLGVWLSLIAAALILLWFISYQTLKTHKIIFISSIILIAAILAFILINRWERLMNLENPQNSITQRLNYWRTALAVIKDYPIAGIGPGNFSEVFLRYKVGLSTDTRYAHNVLLHQWLETGILGIVGLGHLIVVFLKRFKRNAQNTFIFLAGMAFIFHNFIDNTYFIPQTGVFFWILLTLI